ncbi:MAG: hypothetical protein JW912_00805 [Sedimentisphaerales bacterium]|nr:hypothetical protein [Sedimentisphaerales bacterium]
MKIHRSKHKGWITTEVVVSIMLLTTLIGTLAMAMSFTRKFNKYQLVNQQCIAAAQAQLDSITVTGRTIDQETLRRLWPMITVTTEIQTPGEDWQGLELARVRATGRSINRSKEVTVEMSRYFVKGKSK